MEYFKLVRMFVADHNPFSIFINEQGSITKETFQSPE
jgi:hypothetical protein